jgi:hypothetical protein
MPLRRIPQVVVASIFAALAMATTASARLIDEFPLYPKNAPQPPTVRETVVRVFEGPSTVAYVLVAVGVCIALVAAGYLGARVAMRRTSAEVG